MMKVLLGIFYVLVIIAFGTSIVLISTNADIATVQYLMSACWTAVGIAVVWLFIGVIVQLISDAVKNARDEAIAEIEERKRLSEPAEDIEEIIVDKKNDY